MEGERFHGNNFVTVRKPLSEQNIWYDIPLLGIYPEQADIPQFAYVTGEKPLLGRVHTNFEGKTVTEIPLKPDSARLIR